MADDEQPAIILAYLAWIIVKTDQPEQTEDTSEIPRIEIQVDDKVGNVVEAVQHNEVQEDVEAAIEEEADAEVDEDAEEHVDAEWDIEVEVEEPDWDLDVIAAELEARHQRKAQLERKITEYILTSRPLICTKGTPIRPDVKDCVICYEEMTDETLTFTCSQPKCEKSVCRLCIYDYFRANLGRRCLHCRRHFRHPDELPPRIFTLLFPSGLVKVFEIDGLPRLMRRAISVPNIETFFQ